MGKWFRQILQGEHSLFRLSLPFRVRLFNVLALVGGMISLINGISSYVNNQDSVILGSNPEKWRLKKENMNSGSCLMK